MQTFAQRSKATQKPRSVESAISSRGHSGHSPDERSIPPFLQRTIGIQAKVTVSTPGDSYEQEADRISEQVMRTPEPQLRSADTVLRKASSSAGSSPQDLGDVPAVVHDVLRTPGQPLDAAARGFMELRFGQDFSRVRVHADARATDAASAIEARAFAMNSDIVFGPGEYAPATHEGRRLLAHELTHVIQQGSIPRAAVSPASSSVNPMVREVQRASGGVIYRDQKDMPEAVRKKFQGCSQAHSDRDLDVRAEKYARDSACIYKIMQSTLGGGLKHQADSLIQWAAANQFLAGDMLESMYSGAFSTKPLDRLGAGTVYAIASAAGALGIMNKIRDGRFKVRMLHNEEFDTQLAPQALAVYKASDDLLFLRAEGVDITDAFFRSLVMHELTHVLDDAAQPGGTKLDAERRAFLDQARYLLDQLKADETALESVARSVVNVKQKYLITAALIQAKRNKTLDPICKAFIEKISDITEKLEGKRLPSYDKLMTAPLSNLLKLMDKQMTEAGYTSAAAEFDGLNR